LEQPARPAGTLTYHELQGFLFAIVSAPELIRPSEWLPLIFNEHDAGFASLEEANAILGQIMRLYNTINAAVLEERATLPGDCRVRRHALDNLVDGTESLEGFAQSMLRVLPDAVAELRLPGALDPRRRFRSDRAGAEAESQGPPQRSLPVWQRKDVQEVLRPDAPLSVPDGIRDWSLVDIDTKY